jgi:ParB-like chromosome segregation protein Spo0J
MSDRRPIAAIKVGERHRRDLGDLEALARDIAEIGLLHPIPIKPDGNLIAGLRRLEAARLLGWSEVPVSVVDLEDIARGELAENAQRKDFLPSEIDAIRPSSHSNRRQRGRGDRRDCGVAKSSRPFRKLSGTEARRATG